MSQLVDLPDGSTAEFPDDMGHDQISSVIKQHLSEQESMSKSLQTLGDPFVNLYGQDPNQAKGLVEAGAGGLGAMGLAAATPYAPGLVARALPIAATAAGMGAVNYATKDLPDWAKEVVHTIELPFGFAAIEGKKNAPASSTTRGGGILGSAPSKPTLTMPSAPAVERQPRPMSEDEINAMIKSLSGGQ